MPEYVKVKAMRDEASHWYLVPEEEVETFRELSEKAEMGDHEAETLFIESFSQYITGGDLNNTPLYVIRYPEGVS